MVHAEVDSFKLALQALAKNMLRSHGVSTFEESTAWNTDCFPSCQLLHRAQLQLMVALLGNSNSWCYCWRTIPATLGSCQWGWETPKEVCWRARDRPTRPWSCWTGNTGGLPYQKKKNHDIGHQGRDDACSKVGEKKSNNLQLQFTLQIKGAQHLKALLCQHPSSPPL